MSHHHIEKKCFDAKFEEQTKTGQHFDLAGIAQPFDRGKTCRKRRQLAFSQTVEA